MCLKRDCSYVGRDESLWIKGFLIFFIVLGHNMLFTLPLAKWGVMSYLYTFHIQGFFLLPFLYGSKPLSKTTIIKQAVRLYWPFVIIATTIMLVFNIYTHFSNFSFINLIKLYTCCGLESLRTMCGYAALWFLPVMFAVVILKDVYYYCNSAIKAIMIGLGLLTNIYMLANYLIPLPSIPDYLFVPFSALRFLFLGVCCRKIMQLISDINPIYVFIISLLLFATGTILYYFEVSTKIIFGENIWFVFLQLWMPIVFMTLISSALKIWKVTSKSLLSKIGANSLPIYIISPFMGYLLYFTMAKIGIAYWWIGLIAQFVIIALCYIASAYCINGQVRRFLFPRDIADIKSCLKR